MDGNASQYPSCVSKRVRVDPNKSLSKRCLSSLTAKQATLLLLITVRQPGQLQYAGVFLVWELDVSTVRTRLLPFPMLTKDATSIVKVIIKPPHNAWYLAQDKGAWCLRDY
jgi:hypothetical protein